MARARKMHVTALELLQQMPPEAAVGASGGPTAQEWIRHLKQVAGGRRITRKHTSFLIFRLRDSRYAVEALGGARDRAPARNHPAGGDSWLCRRRRQPARADRADHRPELALRTPAAALPPGRLRRRSGMGGKRHRHYRQRGAERAQTSRRTRVMPVPSYGLEAQPDARFLTGLVKSGDQVVMLLHLDNLLRLSPNLEERQGTEGNHAARRVGRFLPGRHAAGKSRVPGARPQSGAAHRKARSRTDCCPWPWCVWARSSSALTCRRSGSSPICAA